MMPKRRYTPPPDPVYQLGKRKARFTKSITAIEAIMSDSLVDKAKLESWVSYLKTARAVLDEP